MELDPAGIVSHCVERALLTLIAIHILLARYTCRIPRSVGFDRFHPGWERPEIRRQATSASIMRLAYSFRNLVQIAKYPLLISLDHHRVTTQTVRRSHNSGKANAYLLSRRMPMGLGSRDFQVSFNCILIGYGKTVSYCD